jgi:Dolichyl-phosphate-mannose-protein mannosyltransferase
MAITDTSAAEMNVPADLQTSPSSAFEALAMPERSGIDLLLGGAAAALAIIWAWPCLSYSDFGGDEGIVLQGAARILRGELPYRDFFSFYTPGSYYIYAALFRVFGVSILAARALLLAYAGFFSFITYLLARRASSRLASLFVACLLALVCLPARFVVIHNWDSSFAALLSFYFAIVFLQTSKTRWAFASGLLAGVTIMVEQSKGAGLVLGLVIAAALLHRSNRGKWKIRHLVAVTVGAALPVCFVIAYFAAHHGLALMLAGWIWPLHHYTAVNKLPFGYISSSRDIVLYATQLSSLWERLFIVLVTSSMLLIPVIPILVIALAAVQGWKTVTRRFESSATSQLVVFSGAVLLGLLLATWATGRPDFLRIIFLAPLFFFAMPLLLDSRLIHMPSLANIQPLIVVCLLISFAIGGLFMSGNARAAQTTILTRRGLLKARAPQEVLPYLDANVRAGANVLVYPYAPTYSFLSATFNPGRYEYLQPGMHTTNDFNAVQRALQEDQTEVVIFDLTFPSVAPDVWPSTPAETLASDPTADFILRHYRPCKRLLAGERPFEFMVRKDLTCPR